MLMLLFFSIALDSKSVETNRENLEMFLYSRYIALALLHTSF
jgi:hypothetical protein